MLSFAGTMGKDLATNLWGISFIFAALMASVVKKIFILLKINLLIDNQRLTTMAETSVDLMVAASIAAISPETAVRVRTTEIYFERLDSGKGKNLKPWVLN
jgi:ESS family glutamate:Na+ symporter